MKLFIRGVKLKTMVFKNDVMVLKAENRPFTGRDGKPVAYAVATVLDNVGNVFDVAVEGTKVPDLTALRQSVIVGEFDLTKGTNKDNRPSLKLRLIGFAPRAK